ncbi:ubiquitin-specific protease ubp2, partial [Entophlyctis luteolus]
MPLGAGAFAAAHVTSLPVSARASLSCRSHEWVRVAAAEEFDPLKRTRTADAEAQDCGSHAMLASGAHSLSRKCSAAVGTLPHHLHASATAIASENKSEDAGATVSVTCCVCSEKTHIETRAQVISQEFLDALFRNRTLEMRLQVLKALTTYVRGWLVDGETGKPVNSQNPNVKEVLGSLPLTDGVPMAHSIMARIGFKFNPVDGGWYRPNARSEEQFALALGAFEELTLLNYNLKSSMGTISPTEASFVDHTSGMRILRSWLGADASEPKRADSENNEYLNPHFKRLGVSEDVSDNELEYAFSKQLHDDPSLKSLYLDSLIEIVQSRPNSYGLQEFVAVERTKHNIHSTSELASAYGLLNLPPPKFHEIDEVHSQRIPADMLVSLFTAQVHSSPALLDDLRASLRIVAAEEGCEDEVDVFLATGFAPATSAADDNFLGMDLAPSVTIADSTRPIGLENFGNICYLNALVQFYLTIKPLRRALFALPAMGNSSPTSSSPSKNAADRSRSFLMLLRDLFVRLSSGDPQATSVGIGRAFALAVAASAVPSGRTVATLSGTAGEETVEDDHGVVGPSADLLLNVQQDVGEFMHVFVEMVEKGFATLGDTKSSEYLKEL